MREAEDEEEEEEGEHTGFLTTHTRSFLWPESHLFFSLPLKPYSKTYNTATYERWKFFDNNLDQSLVNNNSGN